MRKAKGVEARFYGPNGLEGISTQAAKEEEETFRKAMCWHKFAEDDRIGINECSEAKNEATRTQEGCGETYKKNAATSSCRQSGGNFKKFYWIATG